MIRGDTMQYLDVVLTVLAGAVFMAVVEILLNEWEKVNLTRMNYDMVCSLGVFVDHVGYGLTHSGD